MASKCHNGRILLTRTVIVMPTVGGVSPSSLIVIADKHDERSVEVGDPYFSQSISWKKQLRISF